MLQKRWSMAVLSVLRGREADFSFKDTGKLQLIGIPDRGSNL